MTTERESLFPLAGSTLTISIEGDYVKAYAQPDESGIISYGLQGRLCEQVADGVRSLVEQWLEANHGE